jgi:hypothetical protein
MNFLRLTARSRTRDNGADGFRRFVPAIVPSFTEELVSFVLCQTPPRDAGAGFSIFGRDVLPRVRSAARQRRPTKTGLGNPNQNR